MSTERPSSPLSARELEVIALAVRGFTDKEICRKLGITLATIRTHWVRLRAKQGTVNRAQAVATALLGEYERATAHLQDSEERHRAIVEGATDHAIFTLDVERRITSWNPGAERMLGYSEEEAKGQLFDVLFTPEDRQAGMPGKETSNALVEGRAEDVRWHVRRDGSCFWANGFLSRLDGLDGNAAGFLKIMRDDTDQRRVAEALRGLLWESEDGIVCFEFREPVPLDLPIDDVLNRLYRVGYISDCNEPLARRCGYPSCQEMKGMSIGDLWVRSEPVNEETLRTLARASFQGSGLPTLEPDREGNLRPFRNRVKGIIESGSLLRLLCAQSPE